MKKAILIFILFVSFNGEAQTLDQYKLRTVPNLKVLEIRPKLTKRQQTLFFQWLHAEYAATRASFIKQKILAMMQLLGPEDDYNQFFIDNYIVTQVRKDLNENLLPRNNLREKVIPELKKMAAGDGDNKKLTWYLYNILENLRVSKMGNLMSTVPGGNWHYILKNIDESKITTSKEKDPDLKFPPIDVFVTVAQGYQKAVRDAKKNSTMVNGLVVSSLTNGKSIGMPSRIFAKVIRNSREPGRIYLTEETGLDMKRSLSNAILVLEDRFPTISQCSIQVSFDSRRSFKDGNSAGVAFTLLLFSIFENFELDPEVAVTGVIMPDSTVSAVGGVSSKIRGAHRKGISVIVIPEENKLAVDDLTLLFDLSTIWKTQIFSAAEFSDVVKIATTKKAAAVKSSIAKFNKLVPILDAGSKSIRDNRSMMIKELNEILSLTPNHQSARVLKMMLMGKRPKKLSLNGSIDLIFMIADRTIRLDLSVVYETAEESFKNNSAFLRKTLKRIDPKIVPFSRTLNKYIESLLKFRKLAVLNLHKASDSIGTAKNLMNSENTKMEKTRKYLQKIWVNISAQM